MAGKQTHELPPGALTRPADDDAGRELVERLIYSEVCLLCGLFDQSGDQAHLWRAWRSARAAGVVSARCMALLTPRLDRLAVEPRKEMRAEQHERRNWVLLDYYHELARMREARPGAAKNDTEARRRTAKRHGTTEGAVKQIVMEFEGRGQRGSRKKR